MADMFDTATRSRIMSGIRRKNTAPEKLLAKELRRAGCRFRRHNRALPGTPDLSFSDVRLAVFVDGDFWHGRTWFSHGAAPATNTAFWIKKFETNRRRDRAVDRLLRKQGWDVLRLWGSAVNRKPASAALRVLRRIEKRTALTTRSLRRR